MIELTQQDADDIISWKHERYHVVSAVNVNFSPGTVSGDFVFRDTTTGEYHILRYVREDTVQSRYYFPNLQCDKVEAPR